jgi:quercetin dioxygenase-like cupin family protein
MVTATSKSWHATTGSNSQHSKRAYLQVLIAFLIGILVGRYLEKPPQGAQISTVSGSVHRLDETPIRNTLHKDALGRPITKQQFLEPFVVPHVTGYSVATIRPGQTLQVHEHESMHEFFYILEGRGTFQIGGSKDVPVAPGTFLHLAPHESHGIAVPEDSPDGNLKVLLSGVTL